MPVIQKFQFHDFESFREQLVGWESDPLQLEAGALELRWEELRLEHACIAQLAVNRVITDACTVNDGHLSFVVTMGQQHWCGIDVPQGSLILMVPGREYRSRLHAGFRSLEIIVSQRTFNEAGITGDWGDAVAFSPERCVPPLAPELVVGFERLALLLERRATGQVSGTWASGLLQDAIDLLARALHSPGPLIRSRIPRYDLAAAGMALFDEASGELQSVKESSDLLGVTPRALEYAFQSVLRVSPHHYLLSRRLGRVRSRLLQPASRTITDEAFRHGFRHMSRFSVQYRRLFGELPSQTRQSAGRDA